MKLNIEELSNEAWRDVRSAELTDKQMADLHSVWCEALARLIVERCAVECDSVYYQNIGGEVRHGVESCAAAIRNLLEAE